MRRVAWVAACAVLVAGCGGHKSGASTNTAGATISLTSPAFATGGAIPRQYTCDGANTPIPVQWSGVPSGTVELALVMRDPDAPGGTFTHWALAGVKPSQHMPNPAIPGHNDFGTNGYRGPCPPPGRPHRYQLTLLALAKASGLKFGFSPTRLDGVPVLARGRLTGTYSRRGRT